MKLNITILLFIFCGVSSSSFGQEDSKKADPALIKSNTSEIKNSNAKTSSEEVKSEGETKSSGVVKPEPVIIFRDEEKILVKPK